MTTKAQLEARIVELTRICDKETDRADNLQLELTKAKGFLREALMYDTPHGFWKSISNFLEGNSIK